jgi:hypothetical protein
MNIWIPFSMNSSQCPSINWSGGSKLFSSAGWLDVLCCFCGHSGRPCHLLIHVFRISSFLLSLSLTMDRIGT